MKVVNVDVTARSVVRLVWHQLTVKQAEPFCRNSVLGKPRQALIGLRCAEEGNALVGHSSPGRKELAVTASRPIVRLALVLKHALIHFLVGVFWLLEPPVLGASV